MHALGNTLHFDLRRTHKKTGPVQPPLAAPVVLKAVNFHLAKMPKAPISVKQVLAVQSAFHSRFCTHNPNPIPVTLGFY